MAKELTKRTQDEIINRIKEVKDKDWMGTQTGDLVDYLDYEHAKEYLKPEVTAKEWDKLESKTPANRIKDYMSFAWEKANNGRGLSAGRSLDHMYSWLWLDSQDDFLKENDILDYQYYGKDELTAICELYGIDAKQWDDGIRSNTDY